MKLADMVDMNEVMGEEMGSMAEYFDFSDLSFSVSFVFNADGTMKIEMSDATVEKIAEDMIDITIEGVLKLTDEMLQAQGSSLEAALEEQGMSKDQYIATLKSDMDTDDLVDKLKEEMGPINSEGRYGFKDGKLYMGESADTLYDADNETEYEFLGNTLTVKEGDNTYVLTK